jgi:hypothetical protein
MEPAGMPAVTTSGRVSVVMAGILLSLFAGFLTLL